MTGEFSLLLSTLRLVITLLGATFLAVASRAYRRHGSRSLLVLSIAVVLVTASMLWEPLAVAYLGWGTVGGDLGAAFLMVAGLMGLVYSLIVPERASFAASGGERPKS